jgi:hypothetical protein
MTEIGCFHPSKCVGKGLGCKNRLLWQRIGAEHTVFESKMTEIGRFEAEKLVKGLKTGLNCKNRSK